MFGFWQWVALAGFAVGLLLFIQGFRVLRKYHLLADTPRSPIGSLPMGLVEVHGKAKGERLVKSPISGTSCLFYRVDVRISRIFSVFYVVLALVSALLPGASWFFWGRNKAPWTKVFNRSAPDFGGDQFYLEDETGKVLVDGRGAEVDVCCTATKSFFGGHMSGLSGAIRRLGVPSSDREGHWSSFALESYVVSVLTSQPYRVHSPTYQWLMGEDPDAEVPENWGEGRRFHLSEFCIVPDRWYDVTGTCIEDPRPTDLKQRTMIVKGEHEPIFLISDKSESNLERSLKQKAQASIFLGVLLAVFGLGFILASLEMF